MYMIVYTHNEWINAYKCIITERINRRPQNICSMYNMAFLTYSGLLWPKGLAPR